MSEIAEPAHAGEELRSLREQAGMTIEEVAERAGVDVGWLASIEGGEGTHDVLYSHLGRAGEGPRSRLGRNGGTTAMSTT